MTLAGTQVQYINSGCINAFQQAMSVTSAAKHPEVSACGISVLACLWMAHWVILARCDHTGGFSCRNQASQNFSWKSWSLFCSGPPSPNFCNPIFHFTIETPIAQIQSQNLFFPLKSRKVSNLLVCGTEMPQNENKKAKRVANQHP